MATIATPARFDRFARWRAALPPAPPPAWPELAAWLAGVAPLAAAVGAPRAVRTDRLLRWLEALDGWSVLFVPIGRAFGTALEREHLAGLHECLAEQAGEALQPPVHPTALRDRVTELLAFPEVLMPGRTLLVLDGVDEALDGAPGILIEALLEGACAAGDEGPPLRALVTGRDDAAVRGFVPAGVPTLRLDGDTPTRLAALHGPADELATAPSMASPPAAGASLLAEDLAIAAKPLGGARRALVARCLDEWRAADRVRPSAYTVHYLRSHLVSGLRAGEAEPSDVMSLVSPAWLQCWSLEPEGTAGFLSDVAAIRREVAASRAIAEELRCALVEASVLDAVTSAAGAARRKGGDRAERARAMAGLATEATADVREDLLILAEAELGSTEDVEAFAELARAAAGGRRRRWALRAIAAVVRDDAASPLERSELALEMASLAAAEGAPAARAVWASIDPGERGASLPRANLSEEIAQLLWADETQRAEGAPLDARAWLSRALPSEERRRAVQPLSEEWLSSLAQGYDETTARAGLALLPHWPEDLLDRVVLALRGSPAEARSTLGPALAGRLAAAGRAAEAEAWAAALEEPYRGRARVALLAALPQGEREPRADAALRAALDLPDNLALAAALEVAVYASTAAREQAVTELGRRYLALATSHAELGFELARRPSGLPPALARQIFSRLLDHLMHGRLPFYRARFLCSAEGDLRALAPLIRVAGGDAALAAAGAELAGVARAFPARSGD
ncbi:hypothetical protein [Sorangium sp. So ce341]|uniref:hypothetical protein n=1 Tax=Sorangium sp. So ce341 TaxID=3133302 RepID=UPI003F5E8566